MKKIIGVFLAVAFIFSMTACSTKNNTNKQIGTNQSTTKKTTKSKGSTSSTGKKVQYKDGVYDIKHKSTKPGYEEAVVTIKWGKIQNIVLKRLDNNQKEVNYNDWNGTKDGFPNLKKYRVDLANAMLKKQSPDVTVITGATASSNGWKAAVSSALAKAQ